MGNNTRGSNGGERQSRNMSKEFENNVGMIRGVSGNYHSEKKYALHLRLFDVYLALLHHKDIFFGKRNQQNL